MTGNNESTSDPNRRTRAPKLRIALHKPISLHHRCEFLRLHTAHQWPTLAQLGNEVSRPNYCGSITDRRYVNLTTHYDTDSADVLNQDIAPTRATRRRGQEAGTSVHIHESSFRETCFARQLNQVAFLNMVLGRQHRTSPSQLGHSPKPVLSSRWSRGVSA